MPALTLVAIAATTALLAAAGRRVFGSVAWGLVTAAVFATTPLVWGLRTSAPSAVCVLPFIAAWLAAVAHQEDSTSDRWVAAGAVALAAGTYLSYPAVVMMPVYLAITVVILCYSGRMSFRQTMIGVAVFVVAAAPRAVWMLMNWADVREVITTAHLYDARRFNVLQGFREMTTWLGFTARVEVFYDSFNPAFLFLGSDVLLLPLVVLVPAGLYQVANETTSFSRVTAAGFFVAPLAAALTAEPPAAKGISYITPFAAIAAVYGLRALGSLARNASGSGYSRRKTTALGDPVRS